MTQRDRTHACADPLTHFAEATNDGDDQETPTKKKASPGKGKKGDKSKVESEEKATDVKEKAKAEDAEDDF